MYIKAAEVGSIAPAVMDYLGKTVDVFAATPFQGLGLSVFDLSKSGMKTVTADNYTFEIPRMTDLLPHSRQVPSYGSETSVERVANKLAASIGVEGKAGFFSAGLKAKYEESNTSQSYTYYAYVKNSIAFADIDLNNLNPEYFSDDFANDLGSLPAECTSETYPQFARFFHKWGLYFLKRCSLGGELNAFNAVNAYKSTSLQSAELDLKAQYEGMFYSGKFSADVTDTQSWKTFSQYSQTTLYIQGGSLESQTRIMGLNMLEPGNNSVDAFANWTNTIPITPTPAEMYFDPIWDLQSDATKRNALREAARQYITTINFNTYVHYAGSPAGEVWEDRVAVSVNNVYIPPSSTDAPGFQVMVLDRLNPDAGPVSNKLYTYDADNWQNTYEQMYQAMYNYVKSLDANHIVIFSSQHLYGGAFPTRDMADYFADVMGVSKELNTWANSEARKSSNGKITVLFYVVGVPNLGYNKGSGFYGNLFEEYGSFTTANFSSGASVVLEEDHSARIISFQQKTSG
jgi:hypothetical protein